MPKKIAVIGSGFAGLSAASYLSKDGYDVTIFEKNEEIGGRARIWKKDGFTFDMGPSWYWMPEVFEKFYSDFGYASSDFYELKRLDPSYRVYFEDGPIDIPANYEDLRNLFESIETGAAKKLDAFLEDAAYKYDVGVNDLVHRPSLRVSEFIDKRVISGLFKMHLLKSFTKYVEKFFSHPKLISLLEFPILFLGAKPENTPALYSLMNYADMKLGTWYPMGGMHKVIEAFETIALGQGVKIQCRATVNQIHTSKGRATEIEVNGERLQFDDVVCACDYQHAETKLLAPENRSYRPSYWKSRVMAPSALIFYLGINKKVPNLEHHNLFFDKDFSQHAKEIYDTKTWPEEPLFYVCAPGRTDSTVAPKDKENIFVLMPIAPGIEDTPEKRQTYLEILIKRLEHWLKTDLKDSIIVQRSYCISDFKEDYNSFKGNAYGLANTLRQTAFFKPKMKSKKLNNLFYTGQLTTPGPGVPPSIISGSVVASLIHSQNQSV